MTTTAHTVSPEDLMAFLDGELSAAAAEAVAAHLAECEECAGVVTQFRGASQALSLWAVDEGLSEDSEIAIKELAADAAYRHRNARRDSVFHGAWGSWKPWAVAAGFAVVAFVVGSRSISHFSRNRMLFPDAAPSPQAVRLAQQARAPEGASVSLNSRAFMLTQASPPLSSADVERAATANLDATKGPSGLFASKIAPSTPPSEPMIARTVNLTMIVKDFAASRSALDQILARHHGYFAQLEVNTQEEAPA